MSDAQEPDPLVVIKRMGNLLEADLAVDRLWDEGLDAQSEPTNAVITSLNDQGTTILVPQSQAEQAAEVLEEFEKELVLVGRDQFRERHADPKRCSRRQPFPKIAQAGEEHQRILGLF